MRVLPLFTLGVLLSASLQGAETVSLPPHTFTLPDGYTLRRVAAPPLVERPVHMSFDENGVLYATDSSGNTDKAPAQLKDPSHRIMRLVDRDGDGTFDTSTVFAERVPFPEGILVHEDAVYVGAPPHIWKFRDTNGDHLADERTIWFDGGSIGGCGNDMHGPYLGPDGFFYWCKGEFQRQSHVLSDGRVLNSSAAHIYRAKPDGSQLEVVITGGMNNPVGMAFSESGEHFLSGTFFDLSKPGRRDGILHAIYGGVYGRKNDGVLAEHPRTGPLLPILTQLGPSASSGVVMPRNSALGLRGDLLCADFNLRRLSRHRLTPHGSSYQAETSTFLESDQTDFHPTDVIEDADGSLLVADTGSWYLICCPTSKVAKPHVLGGIYRLQRKQAIAPKDPRGIELNWGEPKLAWLSDKRPYVVQRAIAALAEAKNIGALQATKARLPALWTLHRIPGEAARKAVRTFLKDEQAEVRAAALHSVGLWRDRGALDDLIGMLKLSGPYLQRLSAMALGRIGDAKAVAPLLEAGKGELDPFLKHALTYALFEIGEPEALPASHALAKQVKIMNEVAQRHPSPHLMPEIELAEALTLSEEERAQQAQRLEELAKVLPQGNAARGAKIFHQDARAACVTCHVIGEKGTDFGPDLTSIGAIRSERDLLEALVLPSSSIARYYELVTVQKKDGEAAGLLRRDSRDEIVLSPGAGVEVSIPIRDIKGAKFPISP